MSTKKGVLLTKQVLLSILLTAILLPPMTMATSGEVLTNENILSLLRWKARPQEVIAVIERNATRFDLSRESVSKLREAGVTSEVFEAMWKATLKASNNAGAGPIDEQRSTDRSAVNGIAPVDPNRRRNAKPEAILSPPASESPKDPCEALEAGRKEDREVRLGKAKSVVIKNYPTPPKRNESCPFSHDESASTTSKKGTVYHVELDWKTGSISPSCADHRGKYCFALQNVNDIIYDYAFTLNRIEPQGSDLDLLKDAIAKVKDFGGGAPAKGVEKPVEMLAPPPPPCPLNSALAEAKMKAEALQEALTQLDPGKDASGKLNSVPLDTTLAKWQTVPGKFKAFEDAIGELIKLLPLPGDTLPKPCTDCDVARGVAMVLDVYLPVREHYLAFKVRVESQHLARYTADLEPTSAYDVVVKEYFAGQQTTAGAKTFHLDACRKILVSSAGFLLTQLQARGYVSRTAPDPIDPTKTQNVLSVDGGGRMRPALTALLNYNLPWQPWRNGGLAVSAGPVFDISNGKADTSRFGFFGGGSVHLWNRLFLTPGVHVGEFADFPQGFSRPGQVIPDKTGTPNPVKRYTARFAFAITFKVSELGFGSAGAVGDAGKKPPSSQPKSSSQ